MKTQHPQYPHSLIMIFATLILITACEVENTRPDTKIPTLQTSAISGLTQTSAISGGTILDDGGELITSKGICWFTTENPSIANFKTVDGDGTEAFISTLSNLFPGKTYHVRAYAVNSKGVGYGPDSVFTTLSSSSLSIGDNYQGGIIFYLSGSSPNQTGLVCAPADQGTAVPWNSGAYVFYGITDTAIGTGQANTNSLIGILGDGFYAAKLCDELVLNGYSDWFLPSRDELALMYSNLKYNGFGNFSSASYWSSSEYDKLNAHALYFSSGRESYNNKIHSYSVRGVRRIE